VGPILIALISFGLRLFHLGLPKGLVFDEVYYFDGARDFLAHGVEVTGSGPEFIVHPPVGKWCIALGIKLFGNHEFGWRISVAVAGALTIYLVGRIAQSLFITPSLATLASLLMALDGLNLVQSRTALLDLFLTLFVLIAILSWLKGHYWRTGIWFGIACGSKWSGVYFLVAFALLTVYRDRGRIQPFIKLLPKRFVQFFILPVATYLATWTGWLLTSRGWDRQWADGHPSSFGFIPRSLRSLWHYHAEILNFHRSLTQHHAYQANPWSWLVMGRPTSFYYGTPSVCGGPKNCSQEVLALGTPLLWWLGTLAIAVVLGFWIRSLITTGKPEFVSGFILLGLAAGYLPWFFFQRRTIFTFYAIVFEPFVILALVYCAKKFLGVPPWPRNKKVVIAIIVILIAANFLYFLPLFNGSVLSYTQWRYRMWLPSWV
jgi:dolichyl-phosphate-mannose-protein mannosyltransferase